MKNVFIALAAIAGIGFTTNAQTGTERKTPIKEERTAPEVKEEKRPGVIKPTETNKETTAPAKTGVLKPTQNPEGRESKRPEVIQKKESHESVGVQETEVHKNAHKRSEAAPEKKEMKKKKEKKGKK